MQRIKTQIVVLFAALMLALGGFGAYTTTQDSSASAHSYYTYNCMYFRGSWQIMKVYWVPNDAGFNHNLRQNHAVGGYWPTGGYCG